MSYSNAPPPEPSDRMEENRDTTSEVPGTVGVYERPDRPFGAGNTLLFGAVLLIILIVLAVLAFMFLL